MSKNTHSDMESDKGLYSDEPRQRKPYVAPAIAFIEKLEVVAGTCDNGGKTEGGECGDGPYSS